MTFQDLENYNVFALRDILRQLSLSTDGLNTKADLIAAINANGLNKSNKMLDVAQNSATNEKKLSMEFEKRMGVLDLLPEGYGFIRVKNCEISNLDIHVTSKIVKALGLRKGDLVEASILKGTSQNKSPSAHDIISVNGEIKEHYRDRQLFENLIPIFPQERFKLEIDNSKTDFAIRSIDLIAPIGKGQRALIVSPPKAGKTTLLKKVANSITHNYPEVKIFVLLIDERPEEVTDMQRSIKGEVIYSTFDELPEHHTKAADLVIERAKRLVELGQDVIIIMDSLTRLARAHNLTVPPSGRTLSGGIDPASLHAPKRFFGAARNIEDGGSLTIVATALVDTGSRMDDIIYEEFKGTGNMEIHLDRKLSEKRVFPAIDLNRSGTRREDLLLTKDELGGAWAIRRLLSNGDTQKATENLLDMLIKTKNNAEFVKMLNISLSRIKKDGFNM